MADSDAEACGEADGFAAHMKRRGEHRAAQALGKAHGVKRSAQRQSDEKRIHAGAAQHVVTAQLGGGAAGHLAKQLIASVHAEPGIPVSEVVDIEEHQAHLALAALHTVGLAKQHGEQGFAIVDASQVVELRVVQGSVSQHFKLVRHALVAEHEVQAQVPVGRLGRAQHQVVDGALGKTIDPLLCHRVGDEDDGQARAFGLGAHSGQQLADGHAGQLRVEQNQTGRTRRGDGSQRSLRGKHDLHTGAGSQKRGLNRNQQVRVRRCEEKSGLNVSGHPEVSPAGSIDTD